MIEYFVDDEPGTCWVYKDTFSNRIDTFELIHKQKLGNLHGDGTYFEGYLLEYNLISAVTFK